MFSLFEVKQPIFFSKEEYNQFLLRIECDLQNTHNPLYRNTRFITYEILGSGHFSILNTTEALSRFYDNVKENKAVLCHPLLKEKYKRKINHIENSVPWSETTRCSIKSVRGQARFVPPKQEILLYYSNRKEWPRSTYTGKLRKMRKRKTRKHA